MVCVLTMNKYNFSDKKDGSRGSNNNCLIALSKHNCRNEHNKDLEFKQHQKTNITKELSDRNVYFKKLDYKKSDELKQKQKDFNCRANAISAFSFVFDFKHQSHKEFDISANKIMVENYLEEIGISPQRFELLEFVYHADENIHDGKQKSVHFHLTFSAFNHKDNAFNFSDFMAPKGEPQAVLNSKGEQMYKKIERGKNRGEYELNEDGNRIPRTERKRIRKSTEWLQATFKEYLQSNDYIYTNQKEWSSLLQFPNSIYRNFSSSTKDEITYYRELEDLFFESKKNNPNDEALEKIKKEMEKGVSRILEEAISIEENKQKQVKVLKNEKH